MGRPILIHAGGDNHHAPTFHRKNMKIPLATAIITAVVE
jgi:hypothetical protein